MTAKSAIHRASVPRTYVSSPEIDIALFEGVPADAPPALSDLHSEILSARRSERALSIVFISLERLEAGASREHHRKATRRLLQIVSKNLRHTDKCASLNEDEILAILPGADEAGCRIAVQRLTSSSFDKIAASLKLGARLAIGELGPDEASPLAFVDRLRGQLSVELD